jgi:hypothetical protein
MNAARPNLLCCEVPSAISSGPQWVDLTSKPQDTPSNPWIGHWTKFIFEYTPIKSLNFLNIVLHAKFP